MAAQRPPRTLQHPDVTLPLALNAAAALVDRLRSLANSVGPSSLETQFYSRIRVKSIDSINEKITKNRYMYGQDSNSAYRFSELDDLVGFRIVTLYDDELIPAIEYVISLVRAGHQPKQPIFPSENIWESLRSAKFFLRNAHDINDRYLKCHDYLVGQIKPKSISRRIRAKIEKREQLKEHEYSSAHLTFNAISYPSKKMADGRMQSIDYQSHPPIIIPVEFQIRVAHEDIWSEINHKFNYKIKNPYAWSLDFEKSMSHVEQESSALKSIIDRIPEAIDKLVSASRTAKDDLSKFNHPNTNYFFSLGSSLFWCVSGDDLFELGKHFDEYKRLSEAFVALDAARTTNELKLPDSNESERCAELVKCLIHQVRRIEGIVDEEQQDLISCGDPNLSETALYQKVTLLSQRILLCHFDILRLRSLLLLEYDRSLDEDNDLLTVLNEDEKREFSAFLYGELCSFKDNKRLKVRPLSVLMYWKYRLSSIFDTVTARSNLYDAHHELQSDISLPKWSVYRVRIPRDLAAELLLEAGNTFMRLRPSTLAPREMSGTGGEIKSKLVEALRYALEAFDVYVRESHNNMGDFIYGVPEKGEAIRDASQVLEIYLFFRVEFNECLTHSYSMNPDRIASAIRYLEETISNAPGIIADAYPDGYTRDQFEEKIRQAKDFLLSESQGG